MTFQMVTVTHCLCLSHFSFLCTPYLILIVLRNADPTLCRHKKDPRLFRAHALNDLPRRTIENVVELLVREAQGGGSSALTSPQSLLDVDVKADTNTSSSCNSAGRPEADFFAGGEEGHELEKFYLTLIREVRKHQLLFDASNSLYRVTAARNRVWEEIASAFGDGYTGQDEHSIFFKIVI